MKHKLVISIILFLFVLGCQQKSEYVEFYHSNPQDVLVVLERHRCFGSCPAYELFLFGDGTAYLLDNPPSEDLSMGEISGEEFESLLGEMEGQDFFEFEDKYDSPVTDQPAVSTGLKLGDDQKYIYNYAGKGPRSLEIIEEMIDEIKDAIVFTPVELTKEKCDILYSSNFHFNDKDWSEVSKTYCYHVVGVE